MRLLKLNIVADHEVKRDELHRTGGLQEDAAPDGVVFDVGLRGGGRVDADYL